MIKRRTGGVVKPGGGLRPAEVPFIASPFIAAPGSEPTLGRDTSGLPHILICVQDAVATGKRDWPLSAKNRTVTRHKMLRMVCPWNGEMHLLVGDIAIVGKNSSDKVAAELKRIRALGVRGKIITWTKLLQKPAQPKGSKRA